MLYVNILLLLIAFIIFAASGHFVVKSLIKIDKHYRLREFIVGFLLIGIATSIPELSIGVMSALENVSALSFGNIVGSFVVDMTLVIGIVAVVGKEVKLETEIEKRTIFLIANLVLLPLVLFLDHELSRIDGVILVLAFLLYVANMFSKRKKFKAVKYEYVGKRELHENIMIFIISLIGLIVSARIIVHVATEIANSLAIPPILIGLVIISVGTSLPEIFFETKSVLEGYSSMAVGDLLGSLAFNSTLILGIVAILSPVHAHFSSFIISSIFVVISVLAFLITAKTEREITRKEGFVLLLIYVLFLVTNVLAR